jgi:hypothetical protein
MSLKGDGEAALLAFPKENETKFGGTFMGIRTSARRRIVVDSVACYDDSESSGLPDPTPLRTITMFSFSWRAVLRQTRPSTLHHRSRHLSNASTIARYPTIEGFASSLARTQPSFSVSSENVHVLSNPADFYTQLIVRH